MVAASEIVKLAEPAGAASDDVWAGAVYALVGSVAGKPEVVVQPNSGMAVKAAIQVHRVSRTGWRPGTY